MSDSRFRGVIGYAFSAQKIRINASAGVAGEFFKASGQKYDDFYPFADIGTTFAPNQKNYFTLGVQYATKSNTLSQRAPNTIQVNELLYRNGNPFLKNSRRIGMAISYTFLPCNAFSLTAFANYSRSFKRVVTAYDLYDSGNALLQTYMNNGDFTQSNLGLNATLRLLNNSLVFQASPAIYRYHSSGYISSTHSPFYFNISGQYYLGKFNVSAYYSTRIHAMDELTGAYSSTPSYYYLQVGWSNGTWNLSASVRNIFRKSYKGYWADITTPLFSASDIRFNGNYRGSLLVSATYTFGYGKRIKRGNEVGRQSEANSGIME